MRARARARTHTHTHTHTHTNNGDIKRDQNTYKDSNTIFFSISGEFLLYAVFVELFC